jgi:inorganic pyrophosphatase
MKVLIENEAGSHIKHLYDEQTFQLKSTCIVQRAYPFPYGFIIGTQSGMCLDCFLLTHKPIRSGEIVKAEPIGMFEQIENGQEDHNILAVRTGEQFEVTRELQDKLREFVLNVFADVPGKSMRVGSFLSKDTALKLIKASQR